MDVGTQLRDARERRGLTLDAVISATNVSRSILEHIEQNRFDRLPGGILTKGHLRAYARAVGLAPERVVADYIAQCFGSAGEELPLQPPPPVEPGGPTLTLRHIIVMVLLCFAAAAALVWAATLGSGHGVAIGN